MSAGRTKIASGVEGVGIGVRVGTAVSVGGRVAVGVAVVLQAVRMNKREKNQDSFARTGNAPIFENAQIIR